MDSRILPSVSEAGIREAAGLLLPAGILVAAFLVGLFLHLFLKFLLSRRQSRQPITIKGLAIHLHHWYGPLRALIPALCLEVTLPFLRIPDRIFSALHHAVLLWIIVAVAWLISRTLTVAHDFVMSHYRLDAKDNLRARRVYTQMRVIERVLNVLIILVAMAAMMMTFARLRQLGISMIASAGAVGIIVGIAAQHSLGSLIAGIQIAIAQPIRLGDVVIVEDEWGWIEEITLTYVVVRIWDERRLVVPITYFIEKPFQNWTRKTAELLGTVYIYADYTVPIQEVRDELQRILRETPLWNTQAWALQATNATEHTIELRALMSADDSSRAWDLRCLVREKLITFLQDRFPQCLPRVRIEIERDTAK